MPRWPALCGAVSLSLVTAWAAVAAAQADGAPAPPLDEPPTAPTPGEPTPPPPAEPTPPSAAPAPTAPADAQPVPSSSAPQPPGAPPPEATPPANGAFPPAVGVFPLPPTAAEGANKPSPRPAPRPLSTTATTAPPPASPGAAAAQPIPQRATAGLFEEKKPAGPAAKSAKDDDDTDHFKIGPVAGVGFPSVLSFGGTLKLTRFLGAGINLGLIPKVQLNYLGKATLSYQHYDVYGRLYPFGGGFFLSGGAGYATVAGTQSTPVGVGGIPLPPGIPLPAGISTDLSATYNSKGSVRTLMLTALVGYFHTTSIGFSFGVDVGAQIPIAPSQISFSSSVAPKPVESLLPAQIKTQADDSVRSTLEKIGRTPLPTLNLRIGWIL